MNTPLSYIPRQRPMAAVPGRGGQVPPVKGGPKGTAMASSRVTTDTPSHTGRRASAARVRPTGGRVDDAIGTAERTTTNAERNRLKRRNRRIMKRSR